MLKRLKLAILIVWGIGGFVWMFASGVANSPDAPYALAFMMVPMAIGVITWIVTGENKLDKWMDDV